MKSLFPKVFGIVVCLFLTLPGRAAEHVLRGHVPAITAQLRSVGHLSTTNRLNLAIGLPLRNAEVLSNLLQQIYDPASPNFHHYLTPEQFTAQFGPTETDYQAVINFARTNGFTVVRTWSNRTLVDISGNVVDVERAFHVQMRTYQHPREARQFYAPDVEPTVDASLPILSVCGLNNYILARPLYKKKSISNYLIDHFSTGTSPSGSYWGYDFRKAYAPGVTLTGTGQSVALFECDGYYANDVTSYLNATALPSVALTNVLIDGFSGSPSGSGGEVEVALDIDMAISMAPGLSKIFVYESPNDTPAYNLDELNRMAVDNLAKQISSSWVIDDTASFAQVYQQFAVQGQSFFQASGDQGAYYSGIFQKEDSPLVTLVGGTTLTSTGAGGIWAAETVWNGSGGGISTVYSIPAWQTNVSMAANQGSTTMRNVPDVALTANNIYIWGDGSPITSIGGTSCAAPLWAGFMALVNQQLATSGRSSIGFINPAIYSLAQTAAYTNVFHDITTGNNVNSSSPTKFYAVTGYDLCTGWGTPAGQKLIDALAPPIVVTIPASATEGDGLLAGAGQVQLPSVQTSDVVVTLTSGDPAQVSVPASVTVFTGQSNAVFDLTILDDGVLDGTQSATITAASAGGGTGSASMTIFDKETATLQVALPSTVIKGQGLVQGVVQVGAPVATNVTVVLSSDTTNLIQVPASVIISSGQTSAVFTATVLTDGKINGGQIVHVTAHEQNWTDGIATVAVQDNVNLTITLPASAWENAGVLTNAGLVQMAGTSAAPHTIFLTSGNPSKLTVPASVTIPAGSISNKFTITLVDNSIADGHQFVTVTASAAGFTNGTAAMLVLDNESPPIPSNPRPSNLATNVPANTNLRWNNGASTTNELILNGGFETGTFTNWLKTNSGSGDWVINNGTYVPPSGGGTMPPFAGSFSALSEQTGPGTHTLYQDVTLPANASSITLSWADLIRNFATQFTTNSQYFHVEIRGTNNSLLTIAFTTKPGDPLMNNWTSRNFDLTPYAGQTVRIAFVELDSLLYLNVGLDNVSVLANGLLNTNSGVITNDVYFGTNPTPGPAEFRGSTTNFSWTLPLLAPQTTYYWLIIAHRGGSATGAVWQFTTAGVDHFAWNPISSPQLVNQPFAVTVTAKDAFNTTVTNFTSIASLRCAGAGGIPATIEDFESGIWPHSPWVSVSGSTFGAVSSAYAHDGNFGLSDPEWMYRTNVSIGKSGDSLSWWIRPGTGRAYLGFGASSGGCWSVVAAANTSQTSQMLIDQDSAYGFTTVASANQTWQANKWYKIAVQFTTTTSIACYVYDSDGTTVLNSLSYSNVTGLPGGVAIRSFSGFSLDTITSGGSGNGNGNFSMSPTNSGNFVNGVWSGNVTVQQPATNVTLRADDGSSHTGNSNPFDVALTNDISITIADSPHPVSAGANLTYTLTIANTGPSDATGVLVTNLLPANISFISATASQGTCSQIGSTVTANLGVVSGGTNATITIVVTPTVAGTTLTNIATVSRAETDAFLGNNTAAVTTPVTPPAISVADASVVEGNVGTTNMIFSVTLAASSPQAVTVKYSTTNGTATAGSDYVTTNGILTFPPGITNASISVGVIGDIVVEPNETFLVNLSNPTNGVLSRAQAVGTIINDDGFPGNADHFVWSAIASPQFVGESFNVTVTTLDVSNNIAANFNGTAAFSGTTASITPIVSDNFTNGIWSGSVTVQQRATNLVLRADDGNGHSGLSNPFDVVPDNMPPIILLQPTNQTVFVGGAAAFAVAADGTPPLIYQWNFNGTNILGATNSALTLTNVQLTATGNYAVLVTNAFGSVPSSNAVLTVNPPPPVPVITGFSPAAAAKGASVNISGTNFNPNASGNIVYFGATRATVTAASVTNLTVNVPTGATYAPITETVNGLTAYANQPFLPTFAGNNAAIDSSTLAAGFNLPTASGPYRVVMADLDGDGRPDLVVDDANAGAFSIYQNIGTNGVLNSSTFAAPIVFSVPNNSLLYGMVAADVNGDGKLDVVVGDGNNNQIAIFQNLSSGGMLTTNSLAAPVYFAVAADPRTVAVRDLDSDGHPDIICANYTSGMVSILRSTGAAGPITTNSFAARVDLPMAGNGEGLAVGDLDGDGKPDLAVADSSGFISLYRNNCTPGNISASTFDARVDLPAQSGSLNVVIGDLDGDGRPELIASAYLPQTMSVYRNLSTPGSLNTNSFAAPVDYALAGRGHTIALGDINGDGKPDIAEMTELASALSLFQNIGVGSFTNTSLAARVDYAAGWNAWGVAVGDLDGDGRPDVAFANYYDSTITIYQNQTPFAVPPTITSQPASKIVLGGSNVTFSVTASGTLPLNYFWQKNSSLLPGANSASLTLLNVVRTNSGNYSVVITNIAGSITSSNATLLVHVPQRLGVPVLLPDGTLTFTSSDLDGGVISSSDLTNLQAQASTNLMNWINLPNALTLTNGVLRLQDPGSANAPMRFYRIIENW